MPAIPLRNSLLRLRSGFSACSDACFPSTFDDRRTLGRFAGFVVSLFRRKAFCRGPVVRTGSDARSFRGGRMKGVRIRAAAMGCRCGRTGGVRCVVREGGRSSAGGVRSATRCRGCGSDGYGSSNMSRRYFSTASAQVGPPSNQRVRSSRPNHVSCRLA